MRTFEQMKDWMVTFWRLSVPDDVLKYVYDRVDSDNGLKEFILSSTWFKANEIEDFIDEHILPSGEIYIAYQYFNYNKFIDDELKSSRLLRAGDYYIYNQARIICKIPKRMNKSEISVFLEYTNIPEEVITFVYNRSLNDEDVYNNLSRVKYIHESEIRDYLLGKLLMRDTHKIFYRYFDHKAYLDKSESELLKTGSYYVEKYQLELFNQGA